MITPDDIPQRPPLTVNHVGISVPDIRAAIDWYGAAFGFHCIMGPRLLTADSASTAETTHVLGPRFRRAVQAHLLSASGVGLELFEFQDPPLVAPSPDIEYWRPGLWHLCLTDRDIHAALRRVVELGGVQVSPVASFVPGRPFSLVYCRDPWGTAIELMSHSYAEVFANWPHPGATTPTTWVGHDAVGAPESTADQNER
jgi:catechol 2,3-dioxygenase-like lactoylglutathione lyase family enzyme